MRFAARIKSGTASRVKEFIPLNIFVNTTVFGIVGIDIVMLIFAVLMLVYGIQITKQFWNYTWTNIPSFKRGPTWMCLPICGGTASIYLVYQIYEEIMKLVHGGKA